MSIVNIIFMRQGLMYIRVGFKLTMELKMTFASAPGPPLHSSSSHSSSPMNPRDDIPTPHQHPQSHQASPLSRVSSLSRVRCIFPHRRMARPGHPRLCMSALVSRGLSTHSFGFLPSCPCSLGVNALPGSFRTNIMFCFCQKLVQTQRILLKVNWSFSAPLSMV